MKLQNLTHILIGILCIGLLPRAQAVVPPPDGGYPGFNTAEGQNALFSLTTGSANTAVGWYSLFSNTEGSFDTATGAGSLLFNTGDNNTAFGAAALLFNSIGTENTAVGTTALLENTTGSSNTATGNFALRRNTTGTNNTANGSQALSFNNTGNNNTAMGAGAGALITGSGNVCIGAFVSAAAGETDHTYIRNINTTSVSGGGTDSVTVDLTTGLLGHATSSRRYKEDIKPMDKASEALYRLNPVTYRYKREIEPTRPRGFGLIAEDVEKLNPDLVTRGSDGKANSVRYDAVNAMLLNEFIKEHKKVQELEATVGQQQKSFESKLAEQQQQIEALSAGLQKVSAQIQMSKVGAKVAHNNQ